MIDPDSKKRERYATALRRASDEKRGAPTTPGRAFWLAFVVLLIVSCAITAEPWQWWMQ